MISENHPWFLPENFIEKTDTDDVLLYADTDSAYLLYDLPFDKYQDIHQLVDYVQGIARELGTIYNEALEYYLCANAGLNPKYNTMDFKSEVVAYKGFFNSKKFYALAKAWDEGTFFEEKPKLKITGGAIKKSDVTKLTKQLLTDVYSVLVTDIDKVDLVEMYRIIFVQLKAKYKFQIMDSIKNMEFADFSIPKKWGSTEKTIPPPVTGAKLYNYIMEDTFRPSDSFIVVKVYVDIARLLQEYGRDPAKVSEFILQQEEVEFLKNKINVISIPPTLDEEQKQRLLDRLDKLNIRLDYDEIISYNIDTKLEPFEKLFSDDIRMKVL